MGDFSVVVDSITTRCPHMKKHVAGALAVPMPCPDCRSYRVTSVPLDEWQPDRTWQPVDPRGRIDAAVHALLMSDAMTGNDEGTPSGYFVDPENVEYLVRTVLSAADGA